MSDLLDAVQAAMRAIWEAPHPPELQPFMVTASERDWITNPVGDAPSWHAVNVALALGVVDGSDPEVRRMMDHLRGGV